MGALIVMDVHSRTVVQNMIDAKVGTVNNFEWQKQLRYYWEHVHAKREVAEGDEPQDDLDEMDVFAKQTNT